MVNHSTNIKEMYPYAVSYLTRKNISLSFNPITETYILFDNIAGERTKTADEMTELNNRVKPK